MAAFSLILRLTAAAQEGECGPAVLSWLNGLRLTAGLSALEADGRLVETASRYAEELAASGVLSHVDRRGGRVRDRYRALGGTDTLVGEILGSGAQFSSVAAAWLGSAAHREAIMAPAWTHLGVGCARRGENTVWVVLFAARRLCPLQIVRLPSGYRVSGALAAAEAREPVLYSGVAGIPPLLWDPGTREFVFLIPLERGELYHRLGYRTGSGRTVITNTFRPREAATCGPGTALR